MDTRQGSGSGIVIDVSISIEEGAHLGTLFMVDAGMTHTGHKNHDMC
jgi:hypothetical protein